MPNLQPDKIHRVHISKALIERVPVCLCPCHYLEPSSLLHSSSEPKVFPVLQNNAVLPTYHSYRLSFNPTVLWLYFIYSLCLICDYENSGIVKVCIKMLLD